MPNGTQNDTMDEKFGIIGEILQKIHKKLPETSS
jgi:hypothetical protein